MGKGIMGGCCRDEGKEERLYCLRSNQTDWDGVIYDVPGVDPAPGGVRKMIV